MYRDFEIIHTYSQAEAIADGVLVDLSANFPDEAKIYKYPIACTSAVWDLIERATANKNHHQTAAGIVWDILYMSIKAVARRISDSEHLFVVLIVGAGRQTNYTLKAICGPSDDLTPCITILMEFED